MAKKLTLDLSVFKSSGVYTLEFDASESIIVNPQTIRLVVGFSNKGPFNTPVYLQDPQTAIKVFGDIDKSLEKKGSFFHRSIFTCLNSGPIFALNLLKLNSSVDESGNPDVENGADVARYRSYSLDTAEINGFNSDDPYATNNTLLANQDKLVSSYYNKEKFWFPDEKMLLATLHSTDSTKLFSIVNLGGKEVSVIIKKSLDSKFPLRGFDIMASEYFGANNVPIFVHPFDYVSDYFIDVIVVSGNWSRYQDLSGDPIYGGYFTSKGFRKERIDEFLALTEINVILSATGCLIPDFTDENGINQYIKTIINTQVGQTGILCAINEEALDDLSSGQYSLIDLVGHHLTGALNPQNDPITEIDFLSYNSPFASDLTYTQNALTVTDNTGPGELAEVGSLYQFDLTDSGVPTSKFAAFNASNLDGGYPYLQTNFTGVNALTELQDIKNFLSVNAASPAPKFIIGKVTGDLTGNVEASKSFANEDLIKLQIVEVKDVQISPSNVQIRIKFYHPLLNSLGADPEPYDGTSASATPHYQFGKADYFDRYDPIEVSPGPLGSPIPLVPGIVGNYAYYGYGESPIFLDFNKGAITDGDIIHKTWDGSDSQYIKLDLSVDRDGFNTISMRTFVDAELSTEEAAVALGASYKSTAQGPVDTIDTDQLNVISIVGNLNELLDTISIVSPNQVEMTVETVTNSGLKVGDLLVSTDLVLFENSNGVKNNRLTRIVEVKRVPTGTPGQFTIYVKTDRPILLSGGLSPRVNKFRPIHQFIDNIKFAYLPGFQLKSSHKPNGSDSRLDEILDVLFDTNIAKTLSDRNIITFRYVVDTFDGQIKTNSKFQLSKLAKSRQKCLALINAPSMQKFKESIDPRFTDAPTASEPLPLINARYIAEGGNLSLNPSFRFTLPDEELGSKFCGVFSPFLTIRENGKNFNIPPAAHVSNNFIRKFVTGEPYSIVAGQKRGIISGSNIVGVEYDFATEDRDFLEPFGINPIRRIRNIGLVIYGNQTGYQRTNSAFNNLHVRDLLITIEENVEDILANYVFDFNEDSIRLEIKTIVDNYLSGVKNVGGVYNFLTIMDSSNNTPAIIDQNIGIIDIIIEPARGIHKFINRVTVARTGGISSGGFFQFV
jgi:hypothetical protein